MLIFSIIILFFKRTRRVGIVLLMILVVSTILTAYLKCGVGRDRPDLDYLGTPFPLSVENDTFALFCEGGFSSSYPSGHATRVAIFAFVLGYVISEKYPRGCYLLWLYPVLVSLSRLFILQHFPMDVIGGTVLGILLSGVISNRLKLYQIHNKLKS